MTTGEDQLQWQRISLPSGSAQYAMAGTGRPVLFLHGWGLGCRVYEPALRLLASAHTRVYAPSLPGFGGTAPLPSGAMGLAGYARWVAEFIEAAEIDTPLTVIGHSFGGGVAIQLAHDAPELVSRLVLVNAIGGSAWRDGRGEVRPMRERPLWHWGLQLRAEVRPERGVITVVPRIVREALPNLVRNPGGVWRVANVARVADLAIELAALRKRELPVTVAWSDGDTIIPYVSYAALLASLGHPPSVVVSGGHGWLIDNARLFGDVITRVLAEPAEAQASAAA